MILLWITVVLEVGVKAQPQKFCWFAENLGESLKIRVKNGAQCCLTSKNGTQGLQKTHEDLFLQITSKKVFMIFVGENLWAKIAQKPFRASLGRFGQKSFALPNICLLLHLWWKGTFASIVPLLKGRRGKCSRHASILRRPCAQYSALSLLVAVGYNVPL